MTLRPRPFSKRGDAPPGALSAPFVLAPMLVCVLGNFAQAFQVCGQKKIFSRYPSTPVLAAVGAEGCTGAALGLALVLASLCAPGAQGAAVGAAAGQLFSADSESGRALLLLFLLYGAAVASQV